MQIKPNKELYAGWNISDAKDFCKENGFTKDNVRLVDREGQIIVIARISFNWE